MKAMWNGVTLAESNDTIYIEGNHYFPPGSVHMSFFEPSDTHTTCPWKGEASYYHIVVHDQKNTDAAWYYASPLPSAIHTVKRDFTGYIAFWRGVTVTS